MEDDATLDERQKLSAVAQPNLSPCLRVLASCVHVLVCALLYCPPSLPAGSSGGPSCEGQPSSQVPCVGEGGVAITRRPASLSLNAMLLLR